MRDFEVKPSLMKTLKRLYKKDRTTYDSLMNKIEEILNNKDIEHYKNLRYDLKSEKRVHVGSFVLIVSYDKEQDYVIFLDFDHHDKIYKR